MHRSCREERREKREERREKREEKSISENYTPPIPIAIFSEVLMIV